MTAKLTSEYKIPTIHMPKDRLTEERTPKGTLFPKTSTPKQILRQISRGRNRPSKEAELGSQISGYKFAMDFKVSTYYLTRCSISIRNK